jgi:hypothetical protein
MRIVKPTGSLSERPTRVCRNLRVPELAGTPRADDAQPSWHREVVRRHFCPLDQASHHLDSVSEPWSVPLDVRLNGTVVEDRLRQAVEVALARQPRAMRGSPSSPSGMSGRSYPLPKSIPLTSLCVLPSPPAQRPGRGPNEVL